MMLRCLPWCEGMPLRYDCYTNLFFFRRLRGVGGGDVGFMLSKSPGTPGIRYANLFVRDWCFCTRGLEVDPALGRVFDIPCFGEKPGNKLRLHTVCHGLQLQTLSRDIMYEQSHKYVRVGKIGIRGGLGYSKTRSCY